jgi:hypothetical protein
MLDVTPIQKKTPSFYGYTTPVRVIAITVMLGMAALLALLPTAVLWMISLGFFGTTPALLDKAEAMLWLSFLLVPLAIAGTYWLSLLRLRQVETFRAWLEAAGLALIYLLGMPLLVGSGGYALQALHLLDPSTGNNPAVFLTLFGEVPALLLFAVLLTLVTSGIALGFALKFADWHEVRYADLPCRGWLDFLLVLGSISVAALLAGLVFLYLPAGLGLYISVALPGAIIGTIASWRTYHVLQ